MTASMNMINQISFTAGILFLWIKEIQDKRMHQKQTEAFISNAVSLMKPKLCRRKTIMIEDVFYTDSLVKEMDAMNVECLSFNLENLKKVDELDAEAVFVRIDHEESRTAERLRNDCSDVLIIGCCENETCEQLQKALMKGMNGTITVPLSAHDLMKIVCRDSI